jgi:hypothetical protein
MPTTLVMAERPPDNPRPTFLHNRGEFLQPRDRVEPRVLNVLHELPPNAPFNRLSFAHWLVDQRNPLVGRVTVNRQWAAFFGTGIVKTTDDFGYQGDSPTHPELLDWLASTFVAPDRGNGEMGKRGNGETGTPSRAAISSVPNSLSSSPQGFGWSIKRLHRQILLSSTYQMASQGDPKAEAADPQNKLLHRMPVRRLEAEAIRDSILAISGKLETKMYGPGVLPYLTPFMAGRGRPDTSGPLDGQGRRSVYIAVRRNFLTPMFLAFDYPIPFTTMGKRSISTVPAQALTLMNNPFVSQQAGYWGRKALELPNLTPRQRIMRMYEEAYARQPSEAEASAALVFISEQDKTYGTPNDPRSWGDLAHVLFNVKEFIFVN